MEKKRAEALKASKNLIAAIEQGIITEQTKVRLKELEIQISQYDFDIEQAKQRTYSYITPELMMDFFRKAVCGDIESNEVRKVIVRNLIREIVLYEDKVVITFNFVDTPITKKRPPDDIDEIEEKVRQAEKSANKNTKGEYKNTGFPPNRVAFEPAALLFLYQRGCRHHNQYRSLCSAMVRLLLDSEKR